MLTSAPILFDAGAATALVRLLSRLKALHYRFVTPTPATHARVVARRTGPGSGLTDALGWSLPFEAGRLDAEVERLLAAAGALERCDGLTKSRLRVSTLRGELYLHSAYPTDEADAVFFGPDSYRFADLIVAELERCPPPPDPLIVDMGAGCGVGGLVARRACGGEARVLLTDVNPAALWLARINAEAQSAQVGTVVANDLSALADGTDLVVANPPYLLDETGRQYRDGGGERGEHLSVVMAREAAQRLNPGGRLILYSGSAIIGGRDALLDGLIEVAGSLQCELSYRELDPDVFGEELEQPQYSEVERIAVIAAVISRCK